MEERGKTTFVRLFYLTHLDTTTVLSDTGKKDALHASSKKDARKVVIVDLPMSTDMAMVDYNCLENLKDNLYTSSKFDGRTPMGRATVMLILSNSEPDYCKFRLSRWRIAFLTDSVQPLIWKGVTFDDGTYNHVDL